MIWVNGMGNDTADNTENDPVNDPAGKEDAFREREPMHLQEVSFCGDRAARPPQLWSFSYMAVAFSRRPFGRNCFRQLAGVGKYHV